MVAAGQVRPGQRRGRPPLGCSSVPAVVGGGCLCGHGRPRHPRGTSWQTPTSVLVSARGGRGRPPNPRGTLRQTPSRLLVSDGSAKGRLLVSAHGGRGRPPKPRGTSRQTPSSLLVASRWATSPPGNVAADPYECARDCPQGSGQGCS